MTVFEDVVPAIVTNNRNGTYTIRYVIGWEGKYKLNIKLDNLKYHATSLYYEYYSCPIETPVRCNDGSCKEWYSDCGYEYLLQKDSKNEL